MQARSRLYEERRCAKAEPDEKGESRDQGPPDRRRNGREQDIEKSFARVP